MSADAQGDLSSEEGKLNRSQRKQLMAWSHPSGRARRPLETDRESGAIDSILKIACASLFPQCRKQTASGPAEWQCDSDRELANPGCSQRRTTGFPLSRCAGLPDVDSVLIRENRCPMRITSDSEVAAPMHGRLTDPQENCAGRDPALGHLS